MPPIHGQISEGSLPSIDLLSLRYILQLRSAGLEGVSCVQAITLYNPFYELIKLSLVVNMSYTQMVLLEAFSDKLLPWCLYMLHINMNLD